MGIPACRDFDRMAHEIAGFARRVHQIGRLPRRFAVRHPPSPVGNECGDIAVRHDKRPRTWRIDVVACKGAENAGRAIFPAPSAIKRVKRVGRAAIPGCATGRIIVLQQNTRVPWQVEGVAELDVFVERHNRHVLFRTHALRVIGRVDPAAGLSHAFPLEVELPFLRLPKQPEPRRVKLAIIGTDVRIFRQVIQIQLPVAVPRKLVSFAKDTGE